MIIDCIIIEDEPLALKRLKGYVEKLPILNLLESFDNAIDALAFIRDNKMDLIFLDIKMDELTGIELLEALQVKPEVIITTAFDEFAVKGFELDVADYLLKPFSFKRFVQAVNKITDKLKVNKEDRDFIFIKSEYKLQKILFDDILYIEGMSDYRSIQMMDKRILTLHTFGELQDQLPQQRFCRVHKSYMVNIEKIDSIERSRIKIGDKLIPVSDTFKDSFYKIIGYGK